MHLQIVISQDPADPEDSSVKSGKSSAGSQLVESLKLISSTKVVPRKCVDACGATGVSFLTACLQ